VVRDDDLDWCDCPGTPPVVILTSGSTYCNVCKHWVLFGPMTRKPNGQPLKDHRRPADRPASTGALAAAFKNAYPRIAQIHHKMAAVTTAAEWGKDIDDRQFDGFCDACGSLRRHKLMCPRGKR
jgi:hypothetical protein